MRHPPLNVVESTLVRTNTNRLIGRYRQLFTPLRIYISH